MQIAEHKQKEKHQKLNQTQTLIKEFYDNINSTNSPDWADSTDFLDKYQKFRQKKKFISFLDKLNRKITFKPEYDIKENLNKYFFELKEFLNDYNQHENIKKFIENNYKVNLETEFYEQQYNEQYNEYVNEQIEQIKQNIEKNKEQYKTLLDKIKKVKLNKIENISNELNKKLEIGEENWRLLLYSLLSINAHKFYFNTLKARNTINIMLVGDISSGKSTALKIIEQIAPERNGEKVAKSITDFTEASFIGVADKEGINEGVADRMNNRVLLSKEFEEVEIPYLKEYLEGTKIEIYKGGHIKVIEPNTAFITAINPKSDWFVNQIKLREQINYRDAELSRFDYLIPIKTSLLKNEKIIRDISLFEKKEDTLDDISLEIATIFASMENIEAVKLSDEQKEMLKNAFMQHNKQLNDKREVLITIRDFENLARLVNTIVCTNALKRKIENNTIYAENEDIEEAIELWEYNIATRETLYTKDNRSEIIDLSTKILRKITTYNNGKEVYVSDIKKVVVNGDGLCSQATFYRVLRKLIIDKKIIVVNRDNNGRKIVVL